MILNFSDLTPGDHLAVKREGSPSILGVSYYHHGIYCGQFTVVDIDYGYQAVDAKHLEDFRDGGRLQRAEWLYHHLPRYGHFIPGEQVVEMAEYFKENPHKWPSWTLRKNCEAFAGKINSLL